MALAFEIKSKRKAIIFIVELHWQSLYYGIDDL